MNEAPNHKPDREPPTFGREVGAKAKRKVRARRDRTPGVWSGLGMMGLIGWSVVVPTLLGTALGIWLDQGSRARHSWTLMLLVFGLVIGCLNAWRWVSQEDDDIHEDQHHDDE